VTSNPIEFIHATSSSSVIQAFAEGSLNVVLGGAGVVVVVVGAVVVDVDVVGAGELGAVVVVPPLPVFAGGFFRASSAAVSVAEELLSELVVSTAPTGTDAPLEPDPPPPHAGNNAQNDRATRPPRAIRRSIPVPPKTPAARGWQRQTGQYGVHRYVTNPNRALKRSRAVNLKPE
jgi:hypothetical protein